MTVKKCVQMGAIYDMEFVGVSKNAVYKSRLTEDACATLWRDFRHSPPSPAPPRSFYKHVAV